jgi:DNA-binding PadR family transcriptional regulator
MSAKHALLGLLLDRPAYRYQLGHRLQERLGPAWAINSGQLYQTIDRLEKEGLIEPIDGASDDRRDRYIVGITDGGADEYERWFEEDISAAQLLRRPLLVKITLAGPERLQSAVKQIDAYERVCTTRLRELSRQRDEIPTGEPRVRADHVLLRLGLSADITHMEGELGWARHAHEMVSWLLDEHDVIWPHTHQRTHASRGKASDHEGAREELFGRIARRQSRPMPDDPTRDRDD